MGKETSKYSLNADTANDKGNKKKLTKKNEIYQKKKKKVDLKKRKNNKRYNEKNRMTKGRIKKIE